MQTNESCRLCEKIVVTLELNTPIDFMLELPNTFNALSKKYEWKDYAMMAYAIIPQSLCGTTGIVDFYLCVDEDELDDIDLLDQVRKFLQREILPAWNNIKSMVLAGPILTAPVDIGCWKIKHKTFWGNA
jgi:hypothetical protein